MGVGLIIWFIIGAAATWRYYHGLLKGWYYDFNESYLDYKDSFPAIKMVLIGSPILIMGGLFTVLMTEVSLKDYYSPTWWFTTKNK